MHRRHFFHWCSWLLSGAAVLFLAVPGLAFLFDPLRKQRRRSKRTRLAKLDSLPVGEPRKLVITDRRVDAWTRYPEGSVGSVWLVRGDDDTVQAFSSICPHGGCMVEHRASEELFFCPCHRASYANDGSIIEGPQQRGLDALEVSVEKEGDDSWVSVVYQRFETGIAEKTPIG